jgi:cytochrome c oxidase subunit 4
MNTPSHSTTPAAETFDELDPHGVYHGHHSHVILRSSTLMAVLVALLAFTFLTVGATRLEEWVIYDLGFDLPPWVNVFVALSIAVVKSILVAMFFMQLKYDNPMNALAFCFCLFGVALFMGFTLLDLGNRDAIYPWKSGQIQEGGLGVIYGKEKYQTKNMPIVEWARKKYMDALVEKNGGSVEAAEREFQEEEAKEGHAHHAAHGEHGPASTPNRSRNLAGPTPGLFVPATDHPIGEHGSQPHPAETPKSH